jgi:hypothetical protein
MTRCHRRSHEKSFFENTVLRLPQRVKPEFYSFGHLGLIPDNSAHRKLRHWHAAWVLPGLGV